MVGSDVTSERSPSDTQRVRRRQHFGAGTSEPIGADHQADPDPAKPVRVVVLGGGFAGLAAARRLAKAPLDVVVVDQRNFHTFQPLLYQVATAGLDASDVAYPIRTILRRYATIRFLHARAQAVDVDQRIVHLSGGSGLSYDYLVVATGATGASFGVPGVAEHALSLYTLDDARRVRNEVLLALEAADTDGADGDPGGGRVLVVGAGPTGVETAGALSELIDVAVRHDGLHLDPDLTRVTLVDIQSRVLPGLDPRASEYAARALRSRRVDLVLGAQISEVTARGVRLADGRELCAEVVIWVAGVTVDGTLASTLPALTGGGGRVLVRGDLSLDGHPEVYVVGDAAAVSPRRVEDGGPPRLLPQIAQVAIQSGDHVARQISHRAVDEPTAGFVYRDRGMMATIGRRAAIAQFPGGRIIWGTTGWLAWLALHLVYLVGFRNRAIVLVNWAWRYFKWPSGPRLILGDVASRPVTSLSAQDPIVDRDAVQQPDRSTPRAGPAPGRR